MKDRQQNNILKSNGWWKRGEKPKQNKKRTFYTKKNRKRDKYIFIDKCSIEYQQ